MKIILVVTDARGKNLVFVTADLRVYSVQQAVRLAKEGKLKDVYPVERKIGVYLRTKPNVPPEEKLEQLSISSYRLFISVDDIRYALSTPAFSHYWQLYQRWLAGEEKPFIVISGKPRVTKDAVKAKLQAHRDTVFEAAQKFDIDSYLLGAIIIDEIARFKPLEEIGEALAVYFIGKNTSAGIAQVKVDTARGLVKQGYYNPNPNDPRLSKERVNKVSRSYLYGYVKQPEHSIHFAAARMRALTNEWKKFSDLSQKPEIIATLYHLRYRAPHAKPKPDERGMQIVQEFYPLAKEWLR